MNFGGGSGAGFGFRFGSQVGVDLALIGGKKLLKKFSTGLSTGLGYLLRLMMVMVGTCDEDMFDTS